MATDMDGNGLAELKVAVKLCEKVRGSSQLKVLPVGVNEMAMACETPLSKFCCELKYAATEWEG